MTRYTYSRRQIGSCKARVPARGADCALTLGNAIALYQRPVVVHVGPTPMRMGEGYSIPYPWPWVRLDTASGVPTRLDEATFYARSSRGALDVSLRIIGLYQLVDDGGAPVEPQDDPATRPTIAPCLVTVELCQYVTGTAPTILASVDVQLDVVCFPNYVTPRYPLLSLLSIGTGYALDAGYNKDLMNLGAGGVLRVGQLYPADLGLLQRVRLTVEFDAASWSPSFAAALERPIFARVTCIKDTTKSILWDADAATDPELIRIFCVGSQMTMRGRA